MPTSLLLPPDNKQPDYLSRFASVEMRLRKHLSLANDDVWQRCADKLIAALGNMPALEPAAGRTIVAGKTRSSS